MASEPDATELSSALQRLVLNRDVSLIAPFFLGFATMIRTTDPQGTETRPFPPDRFVFFNPLAQQLTVIQATATPSFLDLGRKDGQPPASKASIKAMPSVHITEQTECVICLEDMEVGGVAKQMPCNHKFHANCIEKWLELRGSCPLCRYKMPVDEEDEAKKVDDEATERRVEREIWVSFSFDNAMRNEDSNQIPSSDSDDSS